MITDSVHPARMPYSAKTAVFAVLVLLAAGCTAVAPVPEVGDGARAEWAGDLLGAGPSVELSEPVAGDAMLAGANVLVTGTVDGSLLVAGRDLDLRGPVGQSLRAAGASVRLDGVVGRNATLAGGEVLLERNAEVERNVYLAGGRVEVRGAVNGSLQVASGDVVLNGTVAGDVDVEAGRLRIGPDASIGGTLRYRVDPNQTSIDPGATVEDQVVATPPEDDAEDDGTVLFRVLRILAFLLAGGVVVALAPRTLASAAGTARERSLASLGTGVLVLLLAPIAILVTAFTLIGVPLALIGAVLFAIALYLAPIPAAVWLGDLLTERVVRRSTGPVGDFLTGGAVLAVISFTPVLGVLIRLLAVLLGLGAAVLAARHVRQR